MDEATFRTYVLAECSEGGIDLQHICEEQNIFSKEAFHFLLYNAHLWIEYPADFLLKHMDGSIYTLFVPVIADAVVTKAFMKRIQYKHVMIPKLDELSSPECYERLIMEHPLSKNVYYFFNYLEWISFIFTLTMFCYKEGYDYFELGQQCLASYSGILYFHRIGGWSNLNLAATYVSVIGSFFSTAILKDKDAQKNVVRVLKARKKHERRYRYETNKWTTLNSRTLAASDVREKMSAKFRVVSALDPRRVVAGYKVLINNKSSDMLKRNKGDCSKIEEQTFAREILCKIASESEEATAEIAQRSDLTESSDQKDISEVSCMTEHTESEHASGRVVMCGAMAREPRTSSVSQDESFNSPFELDKNMVFIVNQRLLINTDAVVDKDYAHQRGIKVCSPSTNRDCLIGNLEILYENIKNKNFHHIADDVFVVSPPGCDYEDEDTTVMVLDTSTEDEDDEEFTAPQLYFMHVAFSQPHTCAGVSHSGLRVSSGLSEMSREGSWSSTESPKQRQYLPTRSIGAIPEVKTSTQPETECHATGNLELDRESSQLTVINNLGGERQSLPTSTGAIPKVKTSTQPETECHAIENLELDREISQLTLARNLGREQCQSLPTRSTGAIPKVKTSMQPKIESHAIENLKLDHEISQLTGTNNFGGEQRQSLPTSTGATPKVKTSTQPDTECHATEDLENMELLCAISQLDLNKS